MSEYLQKHPMTGRRVVELGAGAGLPGIIAALQDADKVLLTDYPDEELTT